MAIGNFPAILQPIIQTNYLEKRFQQALRSVLKYRMVADRKAFPTRIGQTLTDTRVGLLAPITTPLPNTAGTVSTAGQTNLDNGMTPDQFGEEQFTITINRYAKTLNLDIVGEQVGIANQFVQNAVALGENAARSLDNMARNALFGAYLGGNTRVNTTLGAAGPTIAVDDVRGFQTTAVYGVQTPISGAATMAVTVGSNVYTLIGFTIDATNVSTAALAGGTSGTLTFSGNVTVADGTAGNAVVAATAPKIYRPSGRASTAALQATDVLTMANLLDAKTSLELNAVPKIGGFYHIYCDPVSGRQLFADPDFKILFQGATMENIFFREGKVYESPILGLRVMETTEAYVTPAIGIAGAYVRRPIICGAGALMEGTFAGDWTRQASATVAEFSMTDGVAMITREPLDRLQQEIAQSWLWIGGWCAPTDLTTSPTTVATSTNAAYKRAVVIEHIG